MILASENAREAARSLAGKSDLGRPGEDGTFDDGAASRRAPSDVAAGAAIIASATEAIRACSEPAREVRTIGTRVRSKPIALVRMSRLAGTCGEMSTTQSASASSFE